MTDEVAKEVLIKSMMRARCRILYILVVAVYQLVAQLSTNPRVSGSIPVFSWLHVEVSVGNTLILHTVTLKSILHFPFLFSFLLHFASPLFKPLYNS